MVRSLKANTTVHKHIPSFCYLEKDAEELRRCPAVLLPADHDGPHRLHRSAVVARVREDILEVQSALAHELHRFSFFEQRDGGGDVGRSSVAVAVLSLDAIAFRSIYRRRWQCWSGAFCAANIVVLECQATS